MSLPSSFGATPLIVLISIEVNAERFITKDERSVRSSAFSIAVLDTLVLNINQLIFDSGVGINEGKENLKNIKQGGGGSK